MKNNFWNISILGLGILLILSLTANIIISLKNVSHKVSDELFTGQTGSSLVKSVSAQEIYPLFICPCCGKTIEAKCCGMARERKLYIDGLSQGRLSKEELILAYVKKYGLDAFKDKSQRDEFKEKLIKESPADRPIISITPDSYDFGDISQKEGTVFTYFNLENQGKSNLTIERLETSCGCTSASIVYQATESPLFSMPGHGINEEIKNWQVVIPPGESAQLKVYYDPDVHQDFRGPAIRDIYVFSNDPIDFEKKVKIELNQVD